MNWIENKIQRTSAARIFVAIAVIVAVAATLAANARYFKNFFKGPYAIPPAELLAAPSADDLPRYWVTLQADDLVETGFQEITVHKKHGVERSREVSANYHVAMLGERLLLVKAHNDKPSAALSGYLKPISGKVDQSFFDDPETQKVRSRFLPMMLDTEDFKSGGEFGLAVAGLLGVGSLIYGLIAFGRYRNPAGHPAAKSAAEWGALNKVSAGIEAEVGSGKVLKLGGYVFTPNYLVRDQMLSFDLDRLDDLLWAYKHVLQKKLYYVIPAGKTFSVCLNWMDNSITVNGKEADVDAVLQYLSNHKPWVLVGYSDELATAYKKKRAEVAEVVAQRRSEATQTAR